MNRCHPKELNFTCDTCGKKFPVWGYLRKHQEKHGVEKRHVCEVCGKRYKFKTGLYLHHKSVHTEVSCERCLKSMPQVEYRKHREICEPQQGLLRFERRRGGEKNGSKKKKKSEA